MVSTKQLEANRRNAQKSTGPKTPEGKATVRLNALKHGLTAGQVLLSDENMDVFATLATALHEQLRPSGLLECMLVDRVVSAIWRLRRLILIEAGMLEERRHTFTGDDMGGRARVPAHLGQ